MQRREFFNRILTTSAAFYAGCAPLKPLPSPTHSNMDKVIDLHTHWFSPEWVSLIQKEATANGAKIGKDSKGNLTLIAPGLNTPFQPQHIDLPTRLKVMDDSGVKMQALSLTSPMVYWAPPAFGLRLSQVYNDSLVKAHQQYPERFVGLASLPMQAPDLALEELKRIAPFNAIRGVYIATHINGKNLNDKSFWPVYAQCEKQGLHLYLHPINPVGESRMQEYYLRNFLGNPYDTGIAAASLMFGGVLDAFPRMEIVLPHAGGAFLALVGRMDHGTGVRPETQHMKKSPSSYLRRFHYDTVGHSVSWMQYLINQVGSDRVVLGTDHPADMSQDNPIQFIHSIPGLTELQRHDILRNNAKRLLHL